MYVAVYCIDIEGESYYSMLFWYMSTSWLNKADFSVIWITEESDQHFPVVGIVDKMMIDSVYICGVCLSD